MIQNEKEAAEFIVKINKILISDDPTMLKAADNPTTINQYFDGFRIVFKSFAEKFLSLHDLDERKRYILNICDLNYLYAIQLKLNYDIPADLQEIAHDFDNPDYPGESYIYKTILAKGYKIQQEV